MQEVTALALVPEGQQKTLFFLELNESSWHYRDTGKYSKGL